MGGVKARIERLEAIRDTFDRIRLVLLPSLSDDELRELAGNAMSKLSDDELKVIAAGGDPPGGFVPDSPTSLPAWWCRKVKELSRGGSK